MYVIEEANTEILLMDFNTAYFAARDHKSKILYHKDCVISETVFNELRHHLSETSKKLFIIDMKNVVSYSPRIFSELEDISSNVVFANIEHEKIRQMLEEDLNERSWEIDGSIMYAKESDKETVKKIYQEDVRKKEIIKIIKETLCTHDIYTLESSGLYSNCYVDIKRLFMDVKKYYYIMFSLAEMSSRKIVEHSIDAFVSSSKNGAIIANILGGLLDIKEIHLIGVGPKYSLELGNPLDCLKNGKRYAYVFDFLCTGTELKIVNALIHAKRAYLKYAVGVARYGQGNENSLFPIETLVNTEDMSIGYKIAGNKELLS